ncbi:hypothetical protein C6401_06875 [Arthrobacter woluwensis]|nr:hypothetical protein C6401_06875 [Arthrobacter woluwensis]
MPPTCPVVSFTARSTPVVTDAIGAVICATGSSLTVPLTASPAEATVLSTTPVTAPTVGASAGTVDVTVRFTTPVTEVTSEVTVLVVEAMVSAAACCT